MDLPSKEMVSQVKHLTKHIQSQDRLLIIEISATADYQGYLPKEAWDWIKQRTFKINR